MRLVDSELERLPGCLAGWRAELIQLEPRYGQTVASCLALPSHRILELHAGNAVAIRWTVPQAGACAVLSGPRLPVARLLGRPLLPTMIVLAGSSTPVDFFVPKGAVLHALMVASPGHVPRRTVLVHEEISARGQDSLGLRQCLRQAHRNREESDLALAVAFQRASAMARVVRGGGIADTPRIAAVVAACQLVDKLFPESVTLSELCRHAGVAQRTLEYGFRQVYETTPLAYMRMHRLTRNRAALLRAGGGASISDTARSCGFTHMGQYTKDYRRLFGETPSMTLARRRSSVRLAAG